MLRERERADRPCDLLRAPASARVDERPTRALLGGIPEEGEPPSPALRHHPDPLERGAVDVQAEATRHEHLRDRIRREAGLRQHQIDRRHDRALGELQLPDVVLAERDTGMLVEDEDPHAGALSHTPGERAGDLTGDGLVNVADLNQALSNWNQACP